MGTFGSTEGQHLKNLSGQMSYKKQNSSIRVRLPSGCRPNDDAGLQVILSPKRTGGAAPQRENDAVCSLKTQAIKEATGALPTLPMLLMTLVMRVHQQCRGRTGKKPPHFTPVVLKLNLRKQTCSPFRHPGVLYLRNLSGVRQSTRLFRSTPVVQ